MIKKAERNGLLCLSGCRSKISKGDYCFEEQHYRGTTRLCANCFNSLNDELRLRNSE